MLSNLLARIHRDGGHYEAAHGTQKAFEDADTLVAELNALKDGQRAGVAEIRGSDIPATMRHDAGAYARCDYCGRYSDNPKSLLRNEWPCDCGKLHGWSGSFKKPTAESQWSAAAPTQQQEGADV